ncbi:hypothetical protein [Sulfobacillus sp. hq2]|uniref:hypothetical protein n=1 Tax=Sulfobacillus TaxID=28033 RepID=UPI000CD2B258|nr:hypothetical protein [Sulfobacillus sp. hq2]POB09682.1 hypothetical protein CO251_15880 [Sulfobacillus sp. hq2]
MPGVNLASTSPLGDVDNTAGAGAPPSSKRSPLPTALRVVSPPSEPAPSAIRLPWIAWVWGNARKAGTSSVALALARWLAWHQTTPVRLLDGHFTQPGLLSLIRTAHVRPGWGWEASWQAGTPAGAPPTVITLTDRLTVWAMGTPMNFVNAARKWPQALKMMPDAAVVVDAGLTPPTVTADLMICVVANGASTTQVPLNTWIAARGTAKGDGARRLILPSEPLGIEGVGSAAWDHVWTPLASFVQSRPASQSN